jgi:hypothetical protein
LIKSTTKTKPNGEFLIRIPAFASCHHIEEGFDFGLMTLKNSNGKYYDGIIWPMNTDCVLSWSPACTFGSWIIDISVPEEDVASIGDNVCHILGILSIRGSHFHDFLLLAIP